MNTPPGMSEFESTREHRSREVRKQPTPKFSSQSRGNLSRNGYRNGNSTYDNDDDNDNINKNNVIDNNDNEVSVNQGISNDRKLRNNKVIEKSDSIESEYSLGIGAIGVRDTGVGAMGVGTTDVGDGSTDVGVCGVGTTSVGATGMGTTSVASPKLNRSSTAPMKKIHKNIENENLTNQNESNANKIEIKIKNDSEKSEKNERIIIKEIKKKISNTYNNQSFNDILLNNNSDKDRIKNDLSPVVISKGPNVRRPASTNTNPRKDSSFLNEFSPAGIDIDKDESG